MRKIALGAKSNPRPFSARLRNLKYPLPVPEFPEQIITKLLDYGVTSSHV